MNPLFNLIMGASKGLQNNLFIQAVNAAMRGESAESFMQNLVQTDPRFRGLDPNNLEKTAEDLCRKKGVDSEALKAQIKAQVENIAK